MDNVIELGWTRWNGGDCPVEPTTLVRVKLRDGEEDKGLARHFQWHSFGGIIAFRVVI